MDRKEAPSLAVVGAGPIGLEAGLYARNLGFNTVIYERGRLSEHVRQWGHVRLFSPFGMNVTPPGLAAIKEANPTHSFPLESDCITGREHVAAYLEPLAKSPSLRDSLRLDTEVLAVGRRGYFKEDGVGDERRGRQ